MSCYGFLHPLKWSLLNNKNVWGNCRTSSSDLKTVEWENFNLRGTVPICEPKSKMVAVPMTSKGHEGDSEVAMGCYRSVREYLSVSAKRKPPCGASESHNKWSEVDTPKSLAKWRLSWVSWISTQMEQLSFPGAIITPVNTERISIISVGWQPQTSPENDIFSGDQ